MNVGTTGAIVDEIECPVCLSDIPQSRRVTTKCGHHFCSGCIYEWMSRKQICPLCRTADPLQYLQLAQESGLIELGQCAISRNGKLISRSGMRMVVRTPDTLLTIIQGKTVLQFKRQHIANIRLDQSRSRVIVHHISTPKLCKPSCIVVEYILYPEVMHAFARFIYGWWLT
jgi:hypothetical protein